MTTESAAGPAAATPPPASCLIGWQPQALAPVFWGVRSLGPADGAPVPLRIFFPSIEGSVESAALLEGCGRYPLIVFAHGHCIGDSTHYRRWLRLPAQLARSGYVVVVPHLAGIAGGQSPSVSTHPDLATLRSVVAWARSGWEHANVLLPPPATGVAGHSYGAMLAARFAVDEQVVAYAGLSGSWGDWFGDAPKPLPLLDLPNLLVWGGEESTDIQLSDATWNQLRKPRHRVIFENGEHWDYLDSSVNVPCRHSSGTCPHLGGATGDLLTMFFGKYLPPELATGLPFQVSSTLEPPPWPTGVVLTQQQEFYAGGFLGGYEALSGNPACAVDVAMATQLLVANQRTKETHSREHPCSFVEQIGRRNRWEVSVRPTGYRWCDVCFPRRADG